MPRKKTTEFDFEASLQQLETIVDDMEAGRLTLNKPWKNLSKAWHSHAVAIKRCKKPSKKYKFYWNSKAN